jgi:signal transduction histidine kinase
LLVELQGGYVCVLTDITPLHRLDALKTQVIRMASHDLRTPITSLRLESDLLKRSANITEQAHVLDRLDRTINDLQRMVNDLLDLERIERQASGFRESVSLRALLDSAISVLTGEIENKRHTLHTEIAGDLPSVCGDPVQLLEVIRNLLMNAVKYTPPGGSIHLYTYTQGEHVCIQVKDNGIGIDAEDVPHLFTPHFRAQTALATAEEGNGIGLSLVKTVVERHGGKVWVESQRGSGSTFAFSLPVDQTCIQCEEL